ATVDITPKGPIWLAGYGDRKKPSEGVDQPLFLKALAVQEGTAPPLVLVTADLIGFSRATTDDITTRLQKELGVPRENFLMIASHTHTGPVLYSNLKTMFDLKEKDEAIVRSFTRELADHAVAAAVAAARNMKPARLSFCRGQAKFAVNRRV